MDSILESGKSALSATKKKIESVGITMPILGVGLVVFSIYLLIKD